jgi:hypothetical protein
MAPAFVTAAIINNKKAIIGTADEVAILISEIKKVPEMTHIIATPSIRAASEAPIKAKLFVAAKLLFGPPVVMSR